MLFFMIVNSNWSLTYFFQVEISLLGLALGVRIEVIRPSLFNKEGFIVHYPDEGADSFDKVHIIQEEQDWNHYSIPVMKYIL